MSDTEPTTIRDCIEAVESDARALASYPGYAECHEVLERIGRNAVAALALLDNGDFDVHTGMTTIPDPLPDRRGLGQICECGHTLGCGCGKCRLCVRPDPAPRGDARG